MEIGQECTGHGPAAQGLGQVAGPGGDDSSSSSTSSSSSSSSSSSNTSSGGKTPPPNAPKPSPKAPKEKPRHFESSDEEEAPPPKPKPKTRPQAKGKGKATPPQNPSPPLCKKGAGTPMGTCRVWGTPGMSLGRRGALGGPSAK